MATVDDLIQQHRSSLTGQPPVASSQSPTVANQPPSSSGFNTDLYKELSGSSGEPPIDTGQPSVGELISQDLARKKGQTPEGFVGTLKQYGSNVIDRVKADIATAQKGNESIGGAVKGAMSLLSIPFEPIMEAGGMFGENWGPLATPSLIHVLSPEQEKKVGRFMGELGTTAYFSTIKTPANILSKTLSILGIGNPEQTVTQKLAQAFKPDPSAEQIKLMLRKGIGGVSQAKEQIWNFAKKSYFWWEGVPKEQGALFQSFMELPEAERNAKIMTTFGMHGPALVGKAKEYRQRLDQSYEWWKTFDDKAHYLRNYWPRMWENEEDASKFFSGYISKLGKQQFMKKRVYDLWEDGIKAGLKPKYTNPEMAVIMRENSGLQYKMAKEFFEDAKGQDLLKAFTKGDIPKGWGKIESPYIPPVIFGDADIKRMKMESNRLFGATEAFKEALRNFKYPTPGTPGKPGVGAMPPREPTVDEILSIWRDLSGGDPKLADYIKVLTDKQKVELAKYAMRGEIPSWFSFKFPGTPGTGGTPGTPGTPGTNIADLVRDFQDIQAGFKNIPIDDIEKHFHILQRDWAMPEDAAKVVNNWLSPSLWSRDDIWGKTWRAGAASKNFRTGIILGLNAFHGFATGRSVTATALNNAVRNFGAGNIKQGLRDVAQMAIVPALKGGGDMIDVYKTGQGTAKELATLELMKRANYRPIMSEQFTYGIRDSLSRAYADLKNKDYADLPKRIIPGISEAIQHPILGFWVPRLKTYSWQRTVEGWIARHPGASELDLDRALKSITDHHDNIFGQVNYDNWFWNRHVRDVATISMLSLGWNAGTWRAMGGAVKDVAGMAVGTKPITYDRIMTAITYPMTVATVGGAMTYYMTGKAPTTMMDYFYPRTGQKDRYGNDERISIPGMHKEAFSVVNAIRKKGIVAGPVEYVRGKQNPDIQFFTDLITNENFLHEEIRNTDSPAYKQAEDVLKHLYDSTLPISVKMKQRAKGLGPALPWLGFNVAPGHITATKTQLEIAELYEKRMPIGVKSQEKVERGTKVQEMKDLLREGKIEEAQSKFRELRQEGVVKESWHEFKRRTETPPDVYRFQRLDDIDKMRLWRKMPAEDRERYRKYLGKSARRQVNSMVDK